MPAARIPLPDVGVPEALENLEEGCSLKPGALEEFADEVIGQVRQIVLFDQRDCAISRQAPAPDVFARVVARPPVAELQHLEILVNAIDFFVALLSVRAATHRGEQVVQTLGEVGSQDECTEIENSGQA